MLTALLLVFAVFSTSASDIVDQSPRSIYAWTNQGLVKGSQDGPNSAQVYLGIPFAAPAQRFKPPTSPAFHWRVFDATKFGNPCPQQIGQNWVTNEDCLNLNIYAPKGACLGSNLPVLVYWYGGSFLFSSNSHPQNQAQALANEGNIIVVTPNHRLGALGFLYVNELTQADGFKGNDVNFAVLDMIRSLEWVKNNIGYFGGDASKVTIGGHSSGAYLSSFLTVVPRSWNLFNNVLQVEGPLTALDQAFVYSAPVANDVGHIFASKVGCTQSDPNEFMKCLTSVDILTLTQAWQPFVLLPVVDGKVFPIAPEVAIADPSKKAVKPAPTWMVAVPMAGTLFVPRYVPLIVAAGGWDNFVAGLYGPNLGPLFSAAYPDSIYGPPGEASFFARGAALISDSLWLCPLRRHATLALAFSPSVYVSMWNVRASFITVPDYFGIIHGTMIPFLFGNSVNIITQQPGQFTADEANLAKTFMKAVGHFVRTGKPGTEPLWTPELYSVINMNNITTRDPLAEIRFPPAGPLPEPYRGDGTRCGLFDFIFQVILAGKIDGSKLGEEVGLKANFWPGVMY